MPWTGRGHPAKRKTGPTVLSAMPSQYIPIFVYAILAAAFPAVTLILFKYIRPDSKPSGAKLDPYECGIPPEGTSRGRYSVRFYIVAILFVIFDVETIFLFPWAVKYGELGVFGLEIGRAHV